MSIPSGLGNNVRRAPVTFREFSTTPTVSRWLTASSSFNELSASAELWKEGFRAQVRKVQLPLGRVIDELASKFPEGLMALEGDEGLTDLHALSQDLQTLETGLDTRSVSTPNGVEQTSSGYRKKLSKINSEIERIALLGKHAGIASIANLILAVNTCRTPTPYLIEKTPSSVCLDGSFYNGMSPSPVRPPSTTA